MTPPSTPFETQPSLTIDTLRAAKQASAISAARRWTTWLAGGMWLASVGCTADVGPCDPVAARTIVYQRTNIEGDPNNGTPMFAGQALMQVSCGSGQFCHANAATGAARYGAPAGLDFDFSVPCDDTGCPGGLERLRSNQSVAFDYRQHILQTLERGSMPPGRIGSAIRDGGGDYVTLDTDDPNFLGGVLEGVPLPEADSAEGRRIVANWLSCGLPVVERYQSAGAGEIAGSSCRGSTDCIIRVEPEAIVIEPTWPSIYERVIGPRCGDTCHGPTETDFREESQLDLSTAELAYDQLVNRPAAGESCVDDATILVIPGDEADGSLLIDKMANREPSCGDPMPIGADGQVPAEIIDIIREWIAGGALENP